MSSTPTSRNRPGYNERLFEKPGLRSYLHNSRFAWFRDTLQQLHLPKIDLVEIGCFDGRLIDFLPQPPQAYFGFDAGWEGGLAAAQRRYADHPHWKFLLARDASALRDLPTGGFNLAAALETIEHIPPDMVDGYLDEIARVTNGYFLVTVPNEKGAIFLSKWLVKKFVMGTAQDYKLREIVAATFGRMNRVERNEHKGFDYGVLVKQIAKRFDIVAVDGVPAQSLPVSLSFTIGIVARSKPAAVARMDGYGSPYIASNQGEAMSSHV